jgi:hypothetical protein
MTEPKTPTREQVLAQLESIITDYTPSSPFTMVATALSYLVGNTAPADPAREAAQIVEIWRQFMVQKLDLDRELKFHQVVNVVVGELVEHRSAMPAEQADPTDAYKRMSYALGQLAGDLLASGSVAVGRGMMARLIEDIGHGLTYEQALSKAGMTPASQPAGEQPAVPDITGATIIRAGVNHVVPDVEPERSAAGARSQWVYTRLWHNAPDGHPIALACPPDGGDGLGWQFMTPPQAREVATELLSAAARAEAEETTGD